MEVFYSSLVGDSIWYPDHHPRISSISAKKGEWLLDKGSLTEKLVAYSAGNFRVNVLAQYWGLPNLHEAVRLNIPHYLAVRVREVELYVNDKAAVFARSIMPLKIYLQQRHTLQNIGTKPLGLLLFKDGRIRVSKRYVSVLDRGPGDQVYGRSTPYQYYGGEILVSEYFIDTSLFKGQKEITEK